MYAGRALEEMWRGSSAARRVALVGGGEPVVVVKGCGKGGRNQELAVRVAMEMQNNVPEGYRWAFMSAGTSLRPPRNTT